MKPFVFREGDGSILPMTTVQLWKKGLELHENRQDNDRNMHEEKGHTEKEWGNQWSSPK